MRDKVNRVLALLLLCALIGIGAGSLILYGRNYAYGFLVSYKEYLPQNPTLMDNIRARLAKLEYNANNRLLGRSLLREWNADLQLMLGKKILSIGTNNMVKLQCGAYYSLFSSDYDLSEVNVLADFAVTIGQRHGIPTQFIYCHAGLYEDGQLPAGTEEFDNNLEGADAMMAAFRARDVLVTDSRDAYARSGLTIEQAINGTDVHWTHRMALESAYNAAADMNEGFDTAFDLTRLDIANFEDELYPSLLLGEYGRRIGPSNVTPDDVHLLYPAYDTHLVYEELNTGVRREGDFRAAVVQEENLTRDAKTGYSEKAYYIYGQYLAQTHTLNEDGAPCRILIFKDSYGTPVAAFLGLVAREVYAVDLRSTDKSMEQWVNEIQPDIVIFAYSQQMLRKFDYVISE